ncbi:hypothetical protein PYW08_011231 [Mythimna loreyi]|uniref:Uncharacterized protein n=1 Tax=Mythimna loreyi TaxID=667449 RepID=A0ACC2Q3K2_9NEOP|nr:hypothetical protein PYW08_011231 [Mythimna loreyi]
MLLSSSLNSSNKNDIDVVTSKPPFISRTKGKPSIKSSTKLNIDKVIPKSATARTIANLSEAEENANKDLEVLQNAAQTVLPVLVIACDRVTVKRCLDNLVKFRPSKEIFPIIVSQTVLPVLVIACDRVTVKRCLDNLVKFRPSKEIFPIIVSQDCGHNATYEVIKSFTVSDPSITVVKQPDLTEIVLPRVKVKFRGYYKIARHYKFALNHVFETLGHEAVIIVEDDLDISPDFFEYFLGTYPLLLKDKSLW